MIRSKDIFQLKKISFLGYIEPWFWKYLRSEENNKKITKEHKVIRNNLFGPPLNNGKNKVPFTPPENRASHLPLSLCKGKQIPNIVCIISSFTPSSRTIGSYFYLRARNEK
jgi:hypothetical protein